MEEGTDDMDGLEAEFPSWTFGEQWHAAGSGPDGRTLTAWRDGVTLSAPTAAGLRRQLREAGG
jgi:hypothetical protein